MQFYYEPIHQYLIRRRQKTHNPGPYLGQAYTVPREGEPGVRVRLYRPADDDGSLLPILFNVHGGGWIFGDAEGVDLQSQYLANHLRCFVVNVDYRLLDEKPFPYPQREVADAAAYFIARASEFHADPDRTAVMGYSAGGHIAAGAAMLLRDRGVKLTTQVLGYPFLNFIGFNCAEYTGFKGAFGAFFNRFAQDVLFETMPKETALLSPANAAPELLKGLAPAVIVSCGNGDPLLPQAEAYAAKLKEAGVPTVYREVKEAIHGFLEHNFKDDLAVFENEDEQDRLMREAVDFIAGQHIFGE